MKPSKQISSKLEVDEIDMLLAKHLAIQDDKPTFLKLNQDVKSKGYSKHVSKFKWSHPTWIVIGDFLKHIFSLSKGEQHKLCKDVVLDYQKDWFSIIEHNSGRDINKLLDLFKRLNVQHNFCRVSREHRDKKFALRAGASKHAHDDDLRAQAFENLCSLPRNVNETCKVFQEAGVRLNNLMETVDNSIENLSTTFDTVVASVLNQINAKIASLSWAMNLVSSWLPTVLLYLAKICALGYLVSLKQNQNLKAITAIVTLALPSSVDGNLNIISGLIRAIKGAISAFVAQSGEEDSFISSFFNLTKGVLAGIFSGVDKDAYYAMHISSKKVKLVSEYIKSASTIMEMLLKIVEKCIEFLGEKILKHYGIIPWFLKEDRITPLVDRFLALKQTTLEKDAGSNRHAALTIKQLYDDIMKVEADIIKGKMITKDQQFKILPYLRVMLRSLEQILSRVPNHLLDGKDMRRSKPFWIYIFGEPRIGKSALFQPYLVNLLVYELKIRQEYEDYTNYTYFRNCGDKYWEKYNNHPVLWYNDLFQNYMDDAAIDLIIPELTAVIDDSLYALNMAFEDKHGVYFNSDIVISNSQKDIVGQGFITTRCLSRGEHLFARRNLVIEFCLNPKYSKDNGIGLDQTKMAEGMKLGNNVGFSTPLFPKDMYYLKFVNPMTGQEMFTLDFENGVKYIVDEAKAYRATQDTFKNRLYGHFKEMFAQTGEDLVPKLEVNYLQCAFCMNLIGLGNFENHVYDCSLRSNHFQYEAEWFDVQSDMTTVESLQQFYLTLLRVAPEYANSPMLTFVGQAFDKGYEPLLKALRNANFNVCDTVDQSRKKIMVICEMGVLHNFETGLEPIVNNSLWDKFKRQVSEAWNGVVNKVKQLLQNEEVLVVVVFLVTYCSVYGTIMMMLGQFKTSNIAQTAEGSSKTSTKQIKRQKVKNKIQAQSYDVQNLVVETKLQEHICKFRLAVRDVDDLCDIDVRHFGSGLNVGSDVFVLPRHFWIRWMEIKEYYKKFGNRVVLKLIWDEDKIVEIPWDTITVWYPDYKHTEDIVFIRINKLIQLTHIKKFFVRVDDQPTLFEAYLFGLRQEGFKWNTIAVSHVEHATSVSYIHESRVEPLYKGTFGEQKIHVPLCYRYQNASTVGGDCGLMLIHTDSKTNCRKILGMHTAGNVKTGSGIASAIFYEDIEEAFENLYKNDLVIQPDFSNLKPCDDVVAQSQEYLNLERSGVKIVGYYDTVDLPDIGFKKKFKITLPRKSKISKSIVFEQMEEDFGPTKVAPAQLRPFLSEGVTISPLYQGLEKIPRCSNMVSQIEIDKVCDHMYESIIMWDSPYKEMRILTEFEMINGYGILKPLDLTTSPGFPYVVINNTNGKHPFFRQIGDNPKRFEMKKLLRSMVENRENAARKGLMVDTYFIDTLKDEVRDLEKVVSGKTRIFQISPMDFNILLRKYFGTFISLCHSTYICGEMAVGINATSNEWTEMINVLLQNAPTFINGDGKNFDASIGQQYMMHVCEVINKMYDDGETNQLVRRVLFATFLNSHHIVGNLVYISRQGNKSGIALTTIFNNLAGMFAIRLAFLRTYNSLHEFFDYISPKFYGDDDLISVKSTCLLDSCGYKKVWAYLGVEYTPADKSAMLKPFYKLSEVSFLKRKFTKDIKYNVYLPQLNFDTIMEIARWSESNPYNMEDQMNRFNSTLLELSNYSSVFDGVRKKFVEYIVLMRQQGFQINVANLFTMEYAKKLIFPHIYGEKSLVNIQRDLMLMVDSCEHLLLDGGGGSE